MTEALPAVQQNDSLIIKYKIPDAVLNISSWGYQNEHVAETYQTEQAAYDSVLNWLINARKSGSPGTFCPPYAEMDPPESVQWQPTTSSANQLYLRTYGIPAFEEKYIPGRYYQPDSNGVCIPYSAGKQKLLRTRSVACPTNLTFDNVLNLCTNTNRATVIGSSQYFLAPPLANPNCEGEGDPCHPATGNKSQRETDIPSHATVGSEFIRFYNSLGDHNSSQSLAPGWRHTYSRQLNESTLGTSDLYQGNLDQSRLYSTASEACTSGWQEIRAYAWNGALSSATASFGDNQNCLIKQSGKTIANFPIRPTLNQHIALPQPNPTSQLITITRPNGQAYHFEKSNGIWIDPLYPEVSLTTDGSNWVFTNADNSRENYDGTGKLLSITSVRGDTQTLTYDTNNRLTRVETSSGDSLQFNYDASNRISAVLDNTGRKWTYRYGATGNLEFVDNPDNTTKQYHYDDLNFIHALTGITDERGKLYATWTYNADGKAISSENGGGVERVDLTYNPDGTTTVTDSRGAIRTYHFSAERGNLAVLQITGDQCTNCPNGDKKNRRYDINGYLSGTTDWGDSVTRYGNYDAKGQYGCKVEGMSSFDTTVNNGSCSFDSSASPNARRTDYTYDPRFFNKITSITEPSVFSGQNKVTTYTYDAFGNRTSETITGFDPSGAPVTRTTTWQYNGPLNQLSFRDGPRTDVSDYTTYRYYPNDSTVPVGSRARLKEIEDANGILTRRNIQYTATGKVASEQRPNGLSLSYTYYPGNDRLQTLTETGPTTSRTTRWTYLATGEVQSITTADGTADATTLTFGYDDARRLTRITDGLGNHIDYTLDTEGNRLAEITYDANGTPSNTADDMIRRQLHQTFDIYNRLDTRALGDPLAPLETTNPDFAPDGTLALSTDGRGAVTDYRYDTLKRLTAATQDLGGTDPTTADANTTYGYDVADRLTTVTDPINGATAYAYDDLGNLLTRTSPDTGTTTFQYDAAGNLLQKSDANGQTFAYTYDALNRLTAIDAPGTADDIAYAYDTCPGGVGRLCTVTYGAGVLPAGNRVHYQYNAFGDSLQHQGMRYGYDAQGRVQTLDYPSGSRVTYRYDAAGQIDQVDFSINGQSQTLASGVRYAPFGPVTDLTVERQSMIELRRHPVLRTGVADIYRFA